MSQMPFEHRRAPRRRTSNVVECSWNGGDAFHAGWVLETSESGLAFAWRGANPPPPDTLIQMRMDEVEANLGPRDAVVRRMSVVHSDLTIIAVEFLCFKPFPPQPSVLRNCLIEPSYVAEPVEPRNIAA